MDRPPRDKRDFARKLRREQTEPERIIWYIVRGRRFLGLKFRRQTPVGPYIADFLCEEKLLVIELDGSQYVENQEYDATRDDYFRSRGYRVVRFWGPAVFDQVELIKETLHKALRQPLTPGVPPGPLPLGEGSQGPNPILNTLSQRERWPAKPDGEGTSSS